MILDKEITITKVFSVNRLLKAPAGTMNTRKNRERWAIILKTEGRTEYKVGQKQYVSDHLHPILVEKGCTYRWRCTEPGECFIIEFDTTQTDAQFHSFDISDNTLIKDNFAKIEKLLQSNDFIAQLQCKQFLYEILSFLFASGPKEYIPKSLTLLIQPAMQYITQAYFDPTITNDYLAQICGISTVYFRKTFEKIYNTSPIHFLQSYRIAKAKALLASDYESIGQVAQSVGYNSIYHFSKMFKQQVGLSPSEYTKSLS